MRQRDRFVTLGFVTLTTLALMVNQPAWAASIASDNVCNSPYNGTNWSNGQNGGAGFGAWSLFQSGSGTSSFFTASAANNGGNCSSGSGINGSCGKAWGAFAGNGAIANARRAFSGSPSALQTNQSFAFSIDNGYINTSGAVGVALENSGNNSVWEFLYVGGNSGSHYSINDGSGSNATTVGYTEGGLTVVFTLTSSTTYSVTITPVGGSTTTVTGTLQNPAGGQAISQFRFYNNEPSSGNGCNYNAFLNSISVACARFTVTAPANQSVCVGNTASFSISAGVANSPGYQWQVSSNSGVAWNPVSTGTGGTTANYTTAATTTGDNGNMFRCVVTDACGTNVTSAAATLTVINATPNIITQPTGQGVCGSNATFTVIASNAVSYLWYKGPTGSGVALGNGGSISGATTPALTLSGITVGDNGANFYVVVSGCGAPQTSTGAVLTLNTPPSISGQPASQTICAGGTAGFGVAASGSPLNFAWRKHGTGWGAGHGWTLTAASGSGSLSVASSSQNGGGGATPNIDTSGQAWALYNISNTATTITTAVRSFPAALQVGQQFQIDMDNGYINSPNTVGFSLLNASSNIVWELYIGGSTPYLIHDNSGTAITTGAAYTEGGIRVVFTLTSATTYSATVKVLSSGNTYGPITGTLLSPTGGSVPAQVRLYDAAGQGGNNYNLYFNNLVVAGAADDNAAAYTNSTWASGQTPNFGNIPLSDGGTISGSTTSNLTVSGISTNDSGATFDCVVIGGTSCGNVDSSTATLTVYPQTGSCILTQPRGVSTYLGGNAVFNVPAQAISYQWYKGSIGGGVALSDGGSVSGSTTPTLTLSGVTLADNGASFYVIAGCCGGSMQTSDSVGLSITTATDGFLKANGLNIRNAHGNGDVVPLHGVNFGAWLLMEGWMCPMDTAGLPDFFLVVQTLATRFGTNTEESLVRTYQNTWIMSNDLDNVRAMGMNVVRVPIMWTDLQRLDGTWRTDAYDRLDWVVSNAWQRGIYTLLDLHGVPGGVSSAQSAGQEDNAYWTSTNDQNQTALIWSNMATHFSGNPAVAGYDLVNEPYGAPTQQAIWDMYNSLYHVVRGVDPDHIIMMEATWKGTGTTNNSLNWVWDVLPPPTLYGWSNVVYSLHEYHFEDTTDVGPVETGMVNQVIDFHNHQSWNVPDYIGEFNMFTPTNGTVTATAVWQFGIQLLNSNNVNWTVWSYKAIHGTIGAVPDSWGLYDYIGTPPPAPNTQADPSTTISNDWAQCGTSARFAINPMLQASLAGPLAVSDLYVTTAGTTLSVNNISGVLGNDLDINVGQPGIQLTATLVNGPINGQLTLNPDGSFSYTPNIGFTGTDTFRYQVNDGYAISVNIGTVVIEVNPASPPPVSFTDWQAAYFGSTTNPLAAAGADPLGKGISNTNQFLLGLNPTNPASVFRVISAVPQGANNILITWKTAGVRTNALQATSPGGSYGTNGFADVSGPIIITVSGDTMTNYTDAGGATNVPSRFYRIRLVP